MNRARLLSQMSPALGYPDVVKSHASNNYLRGLIEDSFSLAIEETKPIAERFRGRNAKETAQNIWDFLRSEIEYVPDEKDSELNRKYKDPQAVRVPVVLLTDGKGDCKSFALFTSGILANLGMPVTLRYTSYDFVKKNPTPTHVYVITEDEQYRPITIDAVWPMFNAQKRFFSKTDVPMTALRLRGVTADMTWEQLKEYRDALLARAAISTGAERSRLIAQVNRINEFARAVLDAKNVNGIGRLGFNQIALSIPRNSYLEIIRLNVRGIATYLKKVIAANPSGMRKKWEKLGGKWSAFTDAVNRGAQKKPLFGSNIKGIGFFGAEIATLLASAAPVVISVAKSVKEIAPAVKDVVNEIIPGGSGDAVVDAVIEVDPELLPKSVSDRRGATLDEIPDETEGKTVVDDENKPGSKVPSQLPKNVRDRKGTESTDWLKWGGIAFLGAKFLGIF